MVLPLYNSPFTHVPRAHALYCLLTQAGPSLMGQEKQMPPSVSLVFLCAYYIIALFRDTDNSLFS